MAFCSQVLCGILIAFIGFILNALYQVGEFSIIYPFNVRHCRRIEGYHGCEDFAYFENKDVYMSCDDRSWLKYHAPMQEYNLSSRIAQQKEQGKIYLLSDKDNYSAPKEVKISGNASPDFHPLGIGSLEDESGKWLFVTDNQRNGEKVLIFQIVSPTEMKLFFEFSLFEQLNDESNRYQMLNDIVVIPGSGGSFYVTIWLVNEPGTWLNFFDVYLKRPVCYILFCEPPSINFLKDGKKKNEWKCRKVVENLKMANGISRSGDSSKIYMAETTGRSMNIYDRNTKTNELVLNKRVDTFSGCDNLEVAQDGKSVFLGCHPKGLTFQFHAAYHDLMVAPSRVLKYVDNGKEGDEMEVVLVSNGEIISGSSLGMLMDDMLIVGSVHDDCYLLCDQN